MNIKDVASTFNTSKAKLKEVMGQLGMNPDQTDLSFAELAELEKIYAKVKQQKMTYEQAIAAYKEEHPEPEEDGGADDATVQGLVEELMKSDPVKSKLVGLTKAEMKKKEEKLRRAIAAHVDRVYNQKIREAVASGELRQAYEKLMAAERGGDIIEAEVLPGESTGQPALPDSSSSDT